ncbi:MAG: sulfite exporter TauE/SafE family protein [Rhodospirillaceae bacterium]|nr:sulfite exporter TauE/SafE family protein [Rhodospirillaceae bacterium]
MQSLLAADATFLIGLIAGLIVTGLAAGVLAGLLGVGGGIVIVPVLYNVLATLGVAEDVRMHVAVGTSLATIIPTAIASARAHARRGAVDTSLVRAWAPFIGMGALMGAVAANLIDGRSLSLVFGVIALLVAVDLVRPRTVHAQPAEGPPLHQPWAGMVGGVIGFFSALMGIGGGTLTVPILSFLKFPIHRAIGTSAVFGLVIALPAATGYIIGGWGHDGLPPGNIGYVNLIGFALIAAITFVSAPWGTRLAHAAFGPVLRWAFALFLVATAVRMLARL